MSERRIELYANKLSRMISAQTVSVKGELQLEKFHAFHTLLQGEFPHLFSACEAEDFSGSLLLRWKGKTQDSPVCFMNHMDVVEATGDWKYPPFSGEIAQGKVWGRGTLDTKGGLFAMLQAADELIAEGFAPASDIYFVSTCTEEVGGFGAQKIVAVLKERGVRFSFLLDEGGMIVEEPIKGARGKYAMVGVGEKGFADLKFIARSNGGHASAPGKDTPLVRLGKFMAEMEKKNPFTLSISPTVAETFRVVSQGLKGPVKLLLKHNRLFRPVLKRVLPSVSAQAEAMLRTTLAFTMAGGSHGANVLPEEAFVIGNMRYSHHQGFVGSLTAVKKVAEKYGLETEVLTPGVSSPMSSHSSEAFRLVKRGVAQVYPEVITTPYLMTAASDSRFFGEVSENCLRFSPFVIDSEQLKSVHGVNENVNLCDLAPAVDFYRFMMKGGN